MITNMQNSITIKIHSFIDVITNSSTEIYVQASESTIKSVKELVNGLLKMGGSTKTADDLFTFELIDPGFADRVWDAAWHYLSDEEAPDDETGDQYEQRVKDLVDAVDKKNPPEWYQYFLDREDESYKHDVDLVVTARDPEAAGVAKILSSLSGLFDMEASYG